MSRLFFCPHAVDTELFDPRIAAHAEKATAARKLLELPSHFRIVLFAGKLVSAKGPHDLLSAFLSLNRENTALVFVGDGPEKTSLEAAAGPRRANIRFLPFANQSEMPARYLLADLFVLPSKGLYETWGLAVNEAMHMGVPCLVSDLVGCQKDLVSPGKTGWVFRAGDPADLKSQLGLALSTLADPRRRKSFRSEIAARISRYTYARAAEGLLEALDSLSGAMRARHECE